MIVFRFENLMFVVLATVFASFSIFLTSIAIGQEIKVMSFEIREQMGQVVSAKPIPLGPRRSVNNENKNDSQKVEKIVPNSVEMEKLDLVDSDSIGTLSELEGGFGTEMWAGSSRPFVVQLLSLLPKQMSSPTQRDLARRLLLTRAEAPQSDAPKVPLIFLRVNALYLMGDYESAMKLMEAASPVKPDEALLKIRAEILFHRYDIKKACALVQGDAQEFKNAYWKQSQAFCLAANGNETQAMLLSDILAEREDVIDPAFFVGMDALSGTKPEPLESFEVFNALLTSLLRAGNVPLPKSLPKELLVGNYASLALSPNAPVVLRVNAGELAALGGALSPSVLSNIYRLQKFSSSVLKQAVSGTTLDWGAAARAMLIQAAMSETAPGNRAKALSRAIGIARKEDDLPLTARAMSYPLRGIRPSSNLAWFAPTAARGLASSGDFALSKEWIKLNGNVARDDNTESLWHLAVLSGQVPAEGVTRKSLVEWHEKNQKQFSDSFSYKARVFYSLLNAVDVNVPNILWRDVITSEKILASYQKPVALRVLLRNAVSSGRTGETIALSLIILGEEGIDHKNFDAAEEVVAALFKIGLKDAARKLALEIAVAAGL